MKLSTWSLKNSRIASAKKDTLDSSFIPYQNIIISFTTLTHHQGEWTLFRKLSRENVLFPRESQGSFPVPSVGQVDANQAQASATPAFEA